MSSSLSIFLIKFRPTDSTRMFGMPERDPILSMLFVDKDKCLPDKSEHQTPGSGPSLSRCPAYSHSVRPLSAAVSMVLIGGICEAGFRLTKAASQLLRLVVSPYNRAGPSSAPPRAPQSSPPANPVPFRFSVPVREGRGIKVVNKKYTHKSRDRLRTLRL